MRIQHVLPSFARVPEDPVNGPRSGITHAALSFARESARQGHEVGLVGWSDARRTTTTPEGLVVDTHPGYRIGRFARWDVRWLAPMMLHSLRVRRPDVLHVHADPNQLRMRGHVKILHLHSFVTDQVSPSYHRLLRQADAVVCCSAFVRDRFLRVTGWDPDRTYVVHNGTDIARQRPATPAERAQVRAHLGIADGALVALYIGAIAPEKGLLHLVRAFRDVCNEHHDATLLVAGSASLWRGSARGIATREEYARQAAAEAPEGTRWLGAVAQDELPRLFQAADLVVAPSIWEEPFGMVALDGAAAGLPVIASNVGGLPEIVDDRRTGMLVDPGDEAALARAVLLLAKDETLRRQLGMAGRERSLTLAWDRVTDKLHAVYRCALEGRVAREGTPGRVPR